MPNQITLPGAPLAPHLKSGVTIRINGSTNVTITEPAATFLTSRGDAGRNPVVAQPMRGVDLRVQELQPGRFYNVVVSFPAGLEIPPGQRAELSLKTSHPQYPFIKVPIYQVARPVPAPAVAPSQAVVQARPVPAAPRSPPPQPPELPK